MSAAEENKVDLDETPQSRLRRKVAKEDSERKSRPADERVALSWFEKGGEKNNKLLKVSLMKSGNVCREFVGMIDGSAKEQCLKLLKENPRPSDEKLEAAKKELKAKAKK